ncbi:MAG: IS21 family transposase [Planctomycetota bacterium]|jgi:transposase
MDQYEFIRTAHRVYEQNISELSRGTGHSRNTIKKAIRGEPWGYQERKHQPFPALGEYLETIDGWLAADREQPKKQRHTARRIYHRLVAECGYAGGESTVRRYVRLAKTRLGINAPKACVPGDPEAGYEAEVDWGTAKAIIAGEEARVKFFCMRSKYSGKHFVRVYPCERQQAFFDGHLHAFAFFGGVFPVLIYDNLTSAVRKVLRGRNRIEQEAFSKFKAYHSFAARFCNPDGANEKGGVEGLVGFARRNYLVPIPQAASLEELNDRVLRECMVYGKHQIDGREKKVGELYEEEKEHLLSLPEVVFGNVQVSGGSADKYATVRVDKNRYSIPSQYVGFPVKVLLYVDRVELFAGGKKRHALLRAFCRGQGETKGIKDFVSVLLLYREYPASEVEAAVDLAVENHIGTNEGVRHLLLYTNEDGVGSAPLGNWASLPPPDVEVYGQLGGVQ